MSWCDRITSIVATCLNRMQVARHIMLGVTLWLTVDSYQWAKGFVSLHPEKSGTDLGLAVGAVLAAITALQTIVFGQYIKSRPKKDKHEHARGTVESTERTGG